MNSTEKAMAFRHACKQFDIAQKISDEDFQRVLEFARLSPSSFGMEHARYLVVQNLKLREKLRKACWNQAQITSASHVIVILAQTEAIKANSDYVKTMFQRRNLPEKALNLYMDKYASHQKSEIEPCMNLYAWSSKQCYISLANIMTGAASLGIDSCPIEGFTKTEVEEVLNIDKKKQQVAVIVTLGYRVGEQTPSLRLPMESLVEYLT